MRSSFRSKVPIIDLSIHLDLIEYGAQTPCNNVVRVLLAKCCRHESPDFVLVLEIYKLHRSPFQHAE